MRDGGEPLPPPRRGTERFSRNSWSGARGICDHKDKDNAVSMALQEISDLREGRLGR